jgi:hypothetical protein
MQQITRDKAEKLLFCNYVDHSDFQQNKKEIWFHLYLDNKAILLVKYDHRSKEKTYFIKNYQPFPALKDVPDCECYY